MKIFKYLYFRDELVEAYGYDIRGEDNAPRARRRRRYGRGPNKYTRNWEDEDAYGKPVGPANPKAGGRGGGQQRTQVCHADVLHRRYSLAPDSHYFYWNVLA